MKNRPLVSIACAVLCAFTLSGAGGDSYRLAVPGYRYEFPRDHFNHPDFQTEWWYYTGNLRTAEGRRFGFELTFFRFGVARDAHTAGESRPSDVWNVRDVWMAHLALSDIDGGHFLHTERFNRAGAGMAGADLAQARVWNGNWQARWRLDPKRPAAVSPQAVSQQAVSQQLEAVADRFSFDLSLRSEKPPVIHGENGVSQKAEGVGRASHYISLTRLITNGSVILDAQRFAVDGTTWMDHEFFTNQLAPDQTGWDWFSLQLDDGSEIMLYRLRRKDGSADPYSSGTYIDPQGRSVHLAVHDFSVTPGKVWTSPDTSGRYPIEWTVRVPSLGLEAALSTPLVDQELTAKVHSAPVYWEGAIDIIGDISGTGKHRPVRGVGYLEMTGYAGLTPLSQ